MLESRIRRDFASLVYDHLGFFQEFDTISVYYDNGQWAVSAALHDALDFVLARNVADYCDANHSARRLLQVADYVCTIERVSISYDRGSQSRTHERFFGTRRDFRQSNLKQLARKRLPQQSGAVASDGSRRVPGHARRRSGSPLSGKTPRYKKTPGKRAPALGDHPIGIASCFAARAVGVVEAAALLLAVKNLHMGDAPPTGSPGETELAPIRPERQTRGLRTDPRIL